MSTEAILMMVVAILAVWGGLAAAVANLLHSDRVREGEQVSDPAGHRDL